MKKILSFISMVIVASSAFHTSCTNDVEIDDLAQIEKERDSWIANGTDTLSFTVTFNNNSVIDKIVASATIRNGTFDENGESEITFKPKRNPENEIESIIVVKSSTTNSEAKVEFNINEYKEEFTINSVSSIPTKIVLSASAFAVANNFDEEITLTGVLTNSNNKMVSKGAKVIVEDFLETGISANGSYRQNSLESNSESKISTIYTPGIIGSDQNIIFIATVLDENNQRTSIKDSLTIFIKTIE